MGSMIVFAGMLFVFFVRDVQLLSSTPRKHIFAKLGFYGACNGALLEAFSTIVASGDAFDVLRIVHTTPLWILGIAWHGIIWLFCTAVTRRGRSELGWLATLLPSPVLLVSLTTVTVLLRHTIGPIGVGPVAAAVAVVWWAMVATAVLCLLHRPGFAFEPVLAIDFAGMANTTALLLAPLYRVFQSF
jgi:hypothetical protein